MTSHPDDLLAAFIHSSAERYASGERSARSDVDTLREIARVLVEFVDDLEPLVEKLDVARDQPQGGFVISRSTWDRSVLSMYLVETIANQLLGYEAGALLGSLVDVELGEGL